jgi:hypothetical protein
VGCFWRVQALKKVGCGDERGGILPLGLPLSGPGILGNLAAPLSSFLSRVPLTELLISTPNLARGLNQPGSSSWSWKGVLMSFFCCGPARPAA